MNKRDNMKNKHYFLDVNKKNEILDCYKYGLLSDTIPFWINNCVDKKYGGFNFCLDRKGTVIDTDKGIWTQGRFTWMLCNLYDQVEKNEEWLELANHGIEFLNKYGFDEDGRMFFLVSQSGEPIRKRRYIFSEAFAVAAFSAYAKVSGKSQYQDKAESLFKFMQKLLKEPGLLPPKLIEGTRKVKGLAVPMILIVTAQILRENSKKQEFCNEIIDASIESIEKDFLKPKFRAVLETVSHEGEFLDHFDGRMLCPGHAIEAAWFILNESIYRNNDKKLRDLGLKILDWMLDCGWDQEYGGIFYYRDVKNHPVQEYWHDMKFWWPHNEAIIATLLAFKLTKNEKYAIWHKKIHDWSYKYFPDKEFGEWYGYLHRDGRISSTLKGNHWKGPFHLPRMQLNCWKYTESICID